MATTAGHHDRSNRDRGLDRLPSWPRPIASPGARSARSSVWRSGRRSGWETLPTIALAVGLAFLFGYSFTIVPLLRSGMALATVIPLALAADRFSILVMEVVDNGMMLAIPGVMEAGFADIRFWLSLAVALAVAFVAAVPVNRWLIAHGRGHALVHGRHG